MFVIVELDEEGLKEKKRQKLMKAGFEARIWAWCEKEWEQALLKTKHDKKARNENTIYEAGWPKYGGKQM